MPAIFMTADDQINCRFEPCAGSLNPNFWKFGKGSGDKVQPTADTEAAFNEKHGPNMSKSHPEVYKGGVLKKAQGSFNRGEFKKALDTLMTAFKLKSLR